MVDSIVSETKRPDLVSDVARYLNQTIRECHFDPETNAAQFYRDNLRELQLNTGNAESSFTWEIPNPANFQQILAVNYLGVFDSSGNTLWPKETRPGRHMRDLTSYFYRVQQTFVFVGFGGRQRLINLAYYSYPSSLPYFAPACRPAYYDDYGGLIYGPDWICDEDKENAKCLTTNWLLERWHTVVAEGVRAKVYKRIADTERARTSYSLYAQLRKGLMTAESAEFFA